MSEQIPTLDPPATAPPAAGRRVGLALLVIAAAQFLIVMDGTVVTVGLPSIGGALGMQARDLAWVLTGYALAFGGLLLVGGRAGDLFGRRRTYRAGLVVLTLTSLLGGLATTGTMLIAARVGQGVAAAFIAPAALSLLATTFPTSAARNKALGVYGAMSGIGPIAGLLLGGALTEYLNWRWILLVNLPVALAILAGTHVLVEGDRERGKVDLPGALTATLGLGALIYAVNQAPTVGWTGRAVVTFGAVAVVLLVAFAVIQTRSRFPMLPGAVVADRGRGGAYLVMLFMGAGMLATYFLLTLYMQVVKGYAPMQTGVVYLPMAVATAVGSGVLAPKLLGRFTLRAVTITGMLLAAAGAAWFGQLTPDQNPWVVLIPAQVVSGTGIGLGFVTLTIAGVRGVAAADTGIASGVINTATQIGAALGLAVLTAVATATTAGQPAGTDQLSALNSGYTAGLLGTGVLFLTALLTAALTLKERTEQTAAPDTQQPDPQPTTDPTDKENGMSVVRHHHYSVDPADLDEHLARRAALIHAIRASHPGLVETRLIRLADGTYTDVWRWDTKERMGAAFAKLRDIPEAGPAMALLHDNNPQNGEIIDER